VTAVVSLYPSLLPHSLQNLAPGLAAPQFMQNLGGAAVCASRVAFGGIEKRPRVTTDFFCAGDRKVVAAGALLKHSRCHSLPSSSKKPTQAAASKRRAVSTGQQQRGERRE